jgi:hypothetical protein
MAKHLNWDRAVAVASWLIVFILAYGALFVMFHDLNPASPIVQFLGVPLTRVIFSVMYGVQAGLLGYAKWKKKDTMRRHTLLFIYLTGFFLSVLGYAIGGFNIRLVSNIVLSCCAAMCWLYWKLRTDYITYDELESHEEVD